MIFVRTAVLEPQPVTLSMALDS